MLVRMNDDFVKAGSENRGLISHRCMRAADAPIPRYHLNLAQTFDRGYLLAWEGFELGLNLTISLQPNAKMQIDRD